MGTGFMWDKDVVVTNHHVVDGASSVKVTLWCACFFGVCVVCVLGCVVRGLFASVV